MFYWKSYQRSFAIFQDIKLNQILNIQKLWEASEKKKTSWKQVKKVQIILEEKKKNNNFFPLVSQKPSCNQINVQGKLVRVTIVWIFHHHSNTRFLSVSQHLSEDSEAHCVQSRCILILIYDWFVSLMRRFETAAPPLVLHVLLPAVSPNKTLLNVFSAEVSVADLLQICCR